MIVGMSRATSLIVQNAIGLPLQIVILPFGQGPEKGAKAKGTEAKRDRDQDQEHGQRVVLLKRSAFRVTAMEEALIAMAAIIGET